MRRIKRPNTRLPRQPPFDYEKYGFDKNSLPMFITFVLDNIYI